MSGSRRRDAAEDFRLMADSAPAMIWVADPQGEAVYFNRAWLEFTGRTLAAELGLGWAGGLHPEDRERTLDAYRRAIREIQPLEIEYRIRRHDGAQRWLLAKGMPVSREGALQGFVGSCIDITERRAAEESARKRERDARDHFLSIVSHDLRTPLNGIKTWAHFLDVQLRDAEPSVRRAIAGVMVGVEQQARLIDELLDLTRALNGKLGLVKHPVALLPLLADAVEEYRAQAAEREIALHTRYELGQAQVHGDAARLRQVFCGLLANAVRFTAPRGEIHVEACVDGATAWVEVRDNGAGIPPEFLPNLFDPFRQADQSANRPVQEGLGVGLALAQRLAQLHGGSIRCESGGAGRGSAFRVSLPLRRESDAHPALTPSHESSATAPSLEGIGVLLIDDQLEARESLAALLGHAGARVRAASSAQEAIALLQSAPRAEGPEVVVCDIAMPEEDGYAALRRIRAWEAQAQPGTRRPAVAISAYGEHGDRVRALREGFQTQLAKPISPSELMLVISNAARGAR